jgi:hypothetical protein
VARREGIMMGPGECEGVGRAATIRFKAT